MLIRLFILVLSIAITSSLSARVFQAVFISDSHLAKIQKAVDNEQEPQHSAFLHLEAFAQQEINRRPAPPKIWYVPGYYRDAAGHRHAKNGLQDDANAAYGLALYYRLTGAVEYAHSAIHIMNDWAQVDSFRTEDDSKLSFSYHFPAMIFAADLLRDQGVWPANQQKAFELFLNEYALPMHTMARQNNWGNWGLVHASACAVYLDDEKLLETCAQRWRDFIEHQIDENGHLPHEVTRSNGQRGIWYTHFCLMPQTLAAHILKINGVDLFDYVAPNGRSLEQAFAPIAQWTRFPESFPYWQGKMEELLGADYFSYFEILNAHWPNDDATALMQQHRPLTARHSAPFLTLTHGF